MKHHGVGIAVHPDSPEPFRVGRTVTEMRTAVLDAFNVVASAGTAKGRPGRNGLAQGVFFF
jgi:hypothetical protein